MPKRSNRERRLQSAFTSLHIEQCEERRLLASISGNVWGDANASKSRDGSEVGLAGWQVFIDANKNGALDSTETSTLTDARGNYRFDNVAAGEVVVGQVLQTGFGQTFPGRDGARGSNFNIDVVFPDDSLTDTQKAVFERAARRWEQLIIGDLPDFTSIAAGRVVDDLAIEARLLNIDGPGNILGQATFTEVRPDAQGGLPTFGFMEFDVADYPPSSANSDDFYSTVLHEMAHVLGLGTLWDDRNLLTGAQTTTPTFVGTQAVTEYNRIFGLNASGVPVEAGGGPGTRNSHWSKEVFGPELMTGFSSPGLVIISTVTVGSLADLGYVVNLSLSDTFTPSLAGASVPFPSAPEGYFINTPKQKVRVLTSSQAAPAAAVNDPGLVAFSQTVDLEPTTARVDVNFGVIRNQNPRLSNVALSPSFQTVGEGIRVRANGLSTFNLPSAVNLNTIAEVQFYRESNSIAGLQIAGDRDAAGVAYTTFDTLIGTDTSGDIGGWAVTARTTSLSPGIVPFYAVAFDQYNFVVRGGASARLVAGPQTIPDGVSSIISRGSTAGIINVSFRDNSDDEVGYRVQVSTDSRFRRGITTREVFASDEQVTGTGIRSIDVSGLQAGTEYFVRVTTFNTAGSAPFVTSGAVTLSPGEVILDNRDAGVRRVGTWNSSSEGSGFLGRDYFVYDRPDRIIVIGTNTSNGSSGGAVITSTGSISLLNNSPSSPPVPSIRYEPSLVAGRSYFVYARRLPDVAEETGNGATTFQVRRGSQLARQITVTRNTPTLPGGWVLLGKFSNLAGKAITVRALGNDDGVVSDAVRFLPSGPLTSTTVSGASGRSAVPIQATLFSAQPIGPERQSDEPKLLD
jgi:Leishmanolysin/SdrD B-like domain